MSESDFELNNRAITLGTEHAMFLISILGLLFNVLVVYIMLFRHRSKQIDIVFMTIIAAVDILIALTVIVSQIAKWATFHSILVNDWFCQYSGLIYMLLTMTSIDGVGLLSIIRSLAIANDIKIKSIYWYLIMGVLLIFNIIFSGFGVVNKIMRIMPSQAYCQPSFSKNSFSKVYSGVMVGKFFLMFVAIVISYICITIKYCKLMAEFSAPKNLTSDYLVGERPALVFQKGVIVRLFILIFMYMLCFMPELVTLIYNISTRTERDPIADSVAGAAMNLTILVNSVFVLFYHEETRVILGSLLPSWIRRDKYISNDYDLNNY
ncbi:hypothetical protein CONCODRAFT_18970 [Conidiobolus coronatus NRRL 28638]|uniref:G-protein coupled receptors family 1 profile domain-containing protein n=1 Tax=Conidiobolus coronatus (strain ATCC 28846 / CBS 209.66 / NRRL 28638) TaxID=796925 RepID=A0A137P0Q5_CONC2|nr:hypothetical protein CONCODRAFT_18970 [Conidiobolus coronatus NRRL 28638]|eukprot:KXN68454.1 hypothetical protein CONCODRAFT_18970 [Conidiobolus coronatus NRRL 28638]